MICDNGLKDIVARVEAGERLYFQDAMRLFNSPDLLTIGYLADLVRKRKTGDVVYFIINRHINHTNICINRCKLCAFGRDKDDPGAYQLSLDEVEEKVGQCRGKKVSEIHVVGGLNPELGLDYYVEMLKRIRRTLPDALIQSFTAVEVDYLAKLHGLPVEMVLQRLKEAGLDSLPGGGAEIFSQRVRDKICEKKISGERWLEVHEAAHRTGMRTNATMLYGHVETIEERVEHLLKLRELQDRTNGFLTFIAFPFLRRNTAMEKWSLAHSTGYDDLKTLAISRLMLDNFDHIKAYWIMLTPKLSQIALAYGIDDLDGTVMEEQIMHDAGTTTDQSMSVEQLVFLIKNAGRIPVQRDTLYNVIKADY